MFSSQANTKITIKIESPKIVFPFCSEIAFRAENARTKLQQQKSLIKISENFKTLSTLFRECDEFSMLRFSY